MAHRIFCCMNIWTCNMSKQRTEPQLLNKKKKTTFYYSFMQSFLSTLNVGKFHKKSYFLIKKLKKMQFLKKTTSGSEWNRWSRSLPSTHPMLARNVRQFWFICCLMHDDRVNLHMHQLTYAIACFCFFFAVFWSIRSVLFQKMRYSTSYLTPVKNFVNGGKRVKGAVCNCNNDQVQGERRWKKAHV